MPIRVEVVNGGEVVLALADAERVTCGLTCGLVLARKKTPKSDSLRKLKMRVLVASTSGALQDHVQAIVRDNRQQAVSGGALSPPLVHVAGDSKGSGDDQRVKELPL